MVAVQHSEKEELSLEDLTTSNNNNNSPKTQKNSKHVFFDEDSSDTTMTDPSSSSSSSNETVGVSTSSAAAHPRISSSRRRSSTRRVHLAVPCESSDEEENDQGEESKEHQQPHAYPKKGVIVHDSEPLSEDEFHAYFTTPEDSKRFDHDVKETIQKWVEYKKGVRQDFDEDEYTMRGLEELVDHMRCKNNPCNQKVSRQDLKTAHIEKVLNEVKRQKRRTSATASSSDDGKGGSSQTLGSSLDAEQLRRVSEGLSEDAVKQALKVAEKDEAAARAVFETDHIPSRRQSAPMEHTTSANLAGCTGTDTAAEVVPPPPSGAFPPPPQPQRRRPDISGRSKSLRKSAKSMMSFISRGKSR